MQRIALSVAEVVGAVGIARSTIYRAMEDGALKSRKVGRRRLILVDDVETWLGIPPGTLRRQ
jgi:excisionase family DNA binding protein